MLKQRIITAAILIPLVILGIFYLPLLWFGWISAIIFLLAGWEWAALAGVEKTSSRMAYLFSLLAAFWILGGFVEIYPLILGVLTWIALPCFLAKPELFGHYWTKKMWFRLLLGIWLLGLAWLALNFIMWQSKGSLLLLMLFLWVWGADVAAYFVGKRYGRYKLAPSISPGKTWEGAWGGILAAFLIGIIGGMFFSYGGKYYLGILVLSLVIAVVSILGDLVESMIKRQCKVKDSGNLLPGHGGLLDRIDSLISAAPVFAAGTVWLEYLR